MAAGVFPRTSSSHDRPGRAAGRAGRAETASRRTAWAAGMFRSRWSMSASQQRRLGVLGVEFEDRGWRSQQRPARRRRGTAVAGSSA